jgi:uncharacterized protein (DUF433 family)
MPEESFRDRISVDSGILCGQPVIKGTRLPVYAIVEAVAAGDSADDLAAAYPFLSTADVEAAVTYAAHRAAWELGCPSAILKA